MDWQKDTGRYIARQVPQQAFQQSLAITKSDFRVVNHYAHPHCVTPDTFSFLPYPDVPGNDYPKTYPSYHLLYWYQICFIINLSHSWEPFAHSMAAVRNWPYRKLTEWPAAVLIPRSEGFVQGGLVHFERIYFVVHSLFQQPVNQRYAKTAAHLTCLQKERMCGTFCNNLIYKNLFSSARPK